MDFNNQPKPLLDIRKDKRRMRELGLGANAFKAIRFTGSFLPAVEDTARDDQPTEETDNDRTV